MLKTTKINSNMESEISFGVSEQVCVTDYLDMHVEELYFMGYTVMENIVPPKVIAAAKEKMEKLESEQIAEMKAAGLKVDNHNGVVRYPLLQDDIFLELATLPEVMSLLRRCLGENFVLMTQAGILNRLNETSAPRLFHRDINYQHWSIGGGCMAVNFLVAIDDFTKKNGATCVLPGTHMVAPFPSSVYAHKHERQVCVSAGSVIVMNAMLFHRAGDNRAKTIRRGVNHVIGRPFMSPYIDIPTALAKEGRDLSDDEFLSKYLGYRWKPAESVLAWHSKRQN